MSFAASGQFGTMVFLNQWENLIPGDLPPCSLLTFNSIVQLPSRKPAAGGDYCRSRIKLFGLLYVVLVKKLDTFVSSWLENRAIPSGFSGSPCLGISLPQTVRWFCCIRLYAPHLRMESDAGKDPCGCRESALALKRSYILTFEFMYVLYGYKDSEGPCVLKRMLSLEFCDPLTFCKTPCQLCIRKQSYRCRDKDHADDLSFFPSGSKPANEYCPYPERYFPLGKHPQSPHYIGTRTLRECLLS